MIDQVLSHYRIIRKLGAGGMGVDGRVILFPRLDSSINDLMLVSRFR